MPPYILDSLPEPGERFTLGECLSNGILASVYQATDSNMSNKKVAIKILKLTSDNESYVQEEYRVLKDYSDHPNLPEFYGAFKNINEKESEIWFAMELCEGGSVMDLVRHVYDKNRRMREEHIAFILKEVTKALFHLHSNNIIHRFISGDNILLTKEGEVKLVDFGLSCSLSDPQDKSNTCIGAACWMAPEVVLAGSGGDGYGSRADVWALGITAIELGDGKPPLRGRVMYQTALFHLHSNNIIHRFISGDNILLTKEGEVKLVDFGLSCSLSDPEDKSNTCIGAACWMAPEVVLAGSGGDGYGSRADVWALGITAIELGDGKPPLSGMHPTRVMFQTVRNPPPGLYRPGCWSEQYNDFVAECLEKNPEYRPYMEELLEHPFLTAIPENCHYLTQELKKTFEDLSTEEKPKHQPEPIVKNNLLQTDRVSEPIQMYVEDLAAIENINENSFLNELKGRFSLGYYHSFVGDVLLVLNPNEHQEDVYDAHHHTKYTLKSRSSNPPHIFSIADRAYQDALHQEVPQHIILSGESGSGKTTSLRHLVSHLLHLGDVVSSGKRGASVQKALEVVHALVNAGTETNPDSTRCVMNMKIGYGPSGKVSTGKVDVWQLEKWRISSTDVFMLGVRENNSKAVFLSSQSNFHILYYFYDAMEASGQLNIYLLDSGRKYRYLRIPSDEDHSNPNDIRNTPESNVEKFESLTQHFHYFFSPEEVDVIQNILSAILNLGEICFNENSDGSAEIENPETCAKVAELLNITEKKFIWALTNYCLVNQGTAVRRKNNCDQARDARDMLANCLYSRLVDWILHYLNNRMAKNKAIFGEKYFVNILDYFGFECFKRNDLEQLLVNTFNEQMQYLYIQRMFAWETLEELEEEITPPTLNYYNNKRGVDHLLGKSEGILSFIDEASKTGHSYQNTIDSIENLDSNPYLDANGEKEFYFSHYTGKIIYDIREMSQKNRDFLPPEMIETLRLSSNTIIRELFVNKLGRVGNLICSELKESKWSSALTADQDKTKKLSVGTQYSQTKHMRTAISTFRSVSLEILRELSVGAGSGGTHFVRCIRTDLASTPKTFHTELIKQQLRALSVIDTARARQLGFPHRITFPEFIRRYKFLAFDFDENVDVTKDNCRLLLVRLKMEGWILGKTKVFLKYYNEEYLSRLYETQVKKIIKIQSMMRAFMARRNIASKLKNLKHKAEVKLVRQMTGDLTTEAAAALMIQKAYRGYNARKKYGPLINKDSGNIDKETANFLKPYVHKWKKKSMFQVLLQYRSAKFQDLVNLSQQVHIFNQNVMHELQKCNEEIDLDTVDPSANSDGWLGDKRPAVWKVPFHFDDLPYFDTEHLCEPGAAHDEDQETWDSPLDWRRSIIKEMKTKDYNKTITAAIPTEPQPSDQSLITTPYMRDPLEPLSELPNLEKETKKPYKSPITSKVTEPPKIKAIGRIQAPANQVIISPKKIRAPQIMDKNFEKANQDFEFIRSPSKPEKLKRRLGNPIAELESIGRAEKSNEDDPPFNFQGMLRKTNFKRDSMKKIIETSEDEPLYSKVLKNKVNKQITSTELAPGIVLEGIETEL